MKHHTGSIEVITGSMFCGKTEELIRRLRRATIARQKVQVFKPAIDIRYQAEKVTSHAGSEYDAIPIESAAEILKQLRDTTVAGIDLAQSVMKPLFPSQSLPVRPARDHCRVGYRFRGEPFGMMSTLMAKAEEVSKLRQSAWYAANRSRT
jgi:thymidine kinase